MKFLKIFAKPVLSKAHLFGHNEFKLKFRTLEVPKGILLADTNQVKTYLTRVKQTTALRPVPMANKTIMTILMELGRLGYALHGDINLYRLDSYKHIALVNKKQHNKITLLYGQVFIVPNDQATEIGHIIEQVMSGDMGWGYEWSSVATVNQ